MRQIERLAADARCYRADLDLAWVFQFVQVIELGRSQHHVELAAMCLELGRDQLAARLLQKDRHGCIIHVTERVKIVVADGNRRPG